ncbi:MAG: transporter [Geobacteraceae bacterium GWC2_58_44]|nr:MAG: transporter [Geobacteraceae bacterium GWC2_58_44]HBG07763.1 transporter [Geobacter sp.]
MAKFQRLMKVLLCAGFLATFAGCASPEKRETAGQYVDDSIVTTRVKAAIFDEMALKTFQINVKTYESTVQLSGFVDTAEHARMAGDIARKVEGVKQVRNDLIVK